MTRKSVSSQGLVTGNLFNWLRSEGGVDFAIKAFLSGISGFILHLLTH